MRPSSRLAYASASSSAAALGKGVLKSSSAASPSDAAALPSKLPAASLAMAVMQRARHTGGSRAYLQESLSSRRSTANASVRRRRRYEPFAWLLHRYIERGSVDLDALIFHPDAPSPAELLLSVMRHRVPCQRLVEHALEAVLAQPRLTSSAGAASFALQSVYDIMRTRCQHLYDTPAIRVLLCEALLSDRLFLDATEVLEGMPDAWITPGLWSAAVNAASEGKIPHSLLLWRLVTLTPNDAPGAGRVVEAGRRLAKDITRGGVSGKDDTDDMVVPFSAFEVRPAALMHFPQESAVEWCKLRSAEIGYAEQHYATLRDERAWGYGTLGVEDMASVGAPKHTTGNSTDMLGECGGDSAKGVAYGLDARLASRLMLRASVSFSGQASPLIALHILRRYIRTCQVVHAQRSGTNAQVGIGHTTQALGGGLVHPSPFLIFFKIMREARDVVTSSAEARAATTTHVGGALSESDADAVDAGAIVPAAGQLHTSPHGGLPMIHWGLVWRFFQNLNRECPTWYTIIPEEAEDLCKYVIDVLCRGADPWMSLNVARAASARHIVNGIDMSLWLLHRLDPSHHTSEACEVTRKVFRWLLVDVGVHLHAQLHHHLVPVSRVLIRLGLQEELRQFYNAVLDNVYAFGEEFRGEFMQVMEDLVCPSCSFILPVQDVFVERTCPLCLTVVLAKDPNSIPSFQLSNEHIARLRERRKSLRIKARQRLHERIERWSREGRSTVESDLDPKSAKPTLPALPPMDAATLFKNEILRDTAPLIPGVSVNSDMPFFLLSNGNHENVMGNDNSSASVVPFDVHAAMEESSRRLQLQEAARRYALAQRGVVSSSSLSSYQLGTLPSLIASSGQSAPVRWRGNAAAHGALTIQIRVDGPWTCVWCQEQNTEWSSRVQCTACGAETGPSAPWRHFAYADTGDVMTEVRARIANSEEQPVDGIVAAYLLMVYRRAFVLRATPHDHERIDQLIRRLCRMQERVLAGYLYVRLVSARTRRKDGTLLSLARLFGCDEAAYNALTEEELIHDEEKFFKTIFTTTTCKVCFGQHAWGSCPIITRDFSSDSARSSINLTPEEKQRAVLQQLRTTVEAAVRSGVSDSRLVVEAYTAFVKSPYRELFAEVNSRDVNQLSNLLSRYGQYRRAAFVLCHVPLHLRDDGAYLVMVPYFDVPTEEARELLRKRSPLGVDDDSHPNFVQVALTCCMCLDERHASFECPRLVQWLQHVDTLCPTANEGVLTDPARDQKVARRLKAQVDGWTSAGPERLHAFYRFLLQQMDAFQEGLHSWDAVDSSSCASSSSSSSSLVTLEGRRPQRRVDMDDPVVYALNRTVAKLSSVGQSRAAYRLYARAPVALMSRHTTGAMLRMNRFTDEGIRTLLHTSGSSSTTPSSSSSSYVDENGMTALGQASETARAAAVPMQNHCLLCFDSNHAYVDCPELAAQPTPAARLEYIAQQIGGIRSSTDGIRAAAAYMYHTYNLGQLTGDMMRANPSLGRALVRLARRCFASGHIAPGARVLRRLPVEMVPPDPIYAELWRAAGIPDGAIEERRMQLLAVYEAEGLEPSIESPPQRQTYSNQFMTNLSLALHDDLCRHCYMHGHTLATCPVFHAEVSFGRDYVAAYRMSMMSEQLDRDWQDAYLLKLVDFFQTHRFFMPYHIVGVTNALNAIAAMWSFRGEPGIALRHFLRIPPSYRRRQGFKHILHALQVPTTEITEALSNVYFVPDEISSSKRRDEFSDSLSHGGAVAQHLLMPKPAIRDVAMSAVFSHFPQAMEALDKSEERMAAIRRRNATQTVTADLRGQPTASKPRDPSVSSLRIMQSGDILSLRDDFDPVLTELELAVGMKLGSRHVLFTNAVDILSAATAAAAGAKTEETPAAPEPQSSSPPWAHSPSEVTEIAEDKRHQQAQKGRSRRDNPREKEETVVTFFASDSAGAKRDSYGNYRKGEHQQPQQRQQQRSSSSSSSHGGTRQQNHYSQRPRYHERRQQEQQQQKHKQTQRQHYHHQQRREGNSNDGRASPSRYSS